MLARLVGEDNYEVAASVEISSTSEKHTTQTAKSDPGEKIDPTIWQLFGENTKRVEQEVKESGYKLAGVSLNVLLDETVDFSADVDIKDALLKSFKGLKANDLTIKRIRFIKKTIGFNEFFHNNRFYVLGVVFFLALAIFLFGPLRSFLKGTALRKVSPKVIDIKMSGSEGMLASNEKQSRTSFGVEEVRKEQPGILEIKEEKPFAFISGENLKNLALIIQNEPPDMISLILSYLKEEDAGKVVSYFHPGLKAKVAVSMLQVRQTDRESVRKAEAGIKEKLEFLVGGLDKFSGILEKMDKETRESILTAVSGESVELAAKVRGALFTFDSLLELDDAALQTVLKELKTETLAKALSGSSEALMHKFTRNLTEGARARLKEEILLAGYLTPLAAEKERARVVKIVHVLEAEGKISISGRGKLLETMSIAPLRKGEEKVNLSYYENQESGKMMSLRKIYKKQKDGKDGVKNEVEKPVGPEKK